MHAHQLILKTVLRHVHTCQKMLGCSSGAASAASLRKELTEQHIKIDSMEHALLRIAAERGWDLTHFPRILPNKHLRRLRTDKISDSAIVQILIREYTETVIQALTLLHSLPYPDERIKSAAEGIRDCLFGCIFRLLEYL